MFSFGCSFFPSFCYIQIDTEPIIVYVPLSEENPTGPTVGMEAVSAEGNVFKGEKVSAIADTPMEGFFDSADIFVEAMASTPIAATREVSIEASISPTGPVLA